MRYVSASMGHLQVKCNIIYTSEVPSILQDQRIRYTSEVPWILQEQRTRYRIDGTSEV
jgi:hypothetical protein